MASWMIHLRVADLLLDRIPDLDETAFVMGNIAPDSGTVSPDWSRYFPPKSVSHFKMESGEPDSGAHPELFPPGIFIFPGILCSPAHGREMGGKGLRAFPGQAP